MCAALLGCSSAAGLAGAGVDEEMDTGRGVGKDFGAVAAAAVVAAAVVAAAVVAAAVGAVAAARGSGGAGMMGAEARAGVDVGVSRVAHLG